MKESPVNICIYTKKQNDEASFKKREHVISKGLGGAFRLQNGYVSDEINEQFSTMELRAFRSPILSPVRQFFNYGEIEETLGTQKKLRQVTLIKEEQTGKILGLGYVKNLFSYIPQLYCKLNVSYALIYNNKETAHEEKMVLIEALKSFSNKCVVIESKDIQEDEFFLGFTEYRKSKTWFLACRDKKIENKLDQYIQHVLEELMDPLISDQEFEPFSNNIKAELKASVNYDEFFRVCAKNVFNCLAYIKGQHFVLDTQFDDIRNWIVQGGENIYTRPNESNIAQLSGFHEVTNEPHIIILRQFENILAGELRLYGGYLRIQVIFTSSYTGPDFDPIVYICDWERKEDRIEQLL